MRLKKSPLPSEQRAYYISPIGTIEIIGNKQGLLAMHFVSKGPSARRPVPPGLSKAVREVDEYFRGKRKKFSLELVLRGTEFQKAVWRRLVEIPYGETVSYGQVAKAVGKPKAVRAVGMANAVNRIGVIIPCHRVIGSDGQLTGYGGGLWRKKWLLAHERKWAKNQK